MRRAVFIFAVVWLALVGTTVAQDAVPSDILNRTFLIKAGNEGGTAFAVDYESKLYIVTAKHVVAGLPHVDVLQPSRLCGRPAGKISTQLLTFA